MNPALHAVLALTFVPGLGPRKIRGLLGHFGDAETAKAAALTDLRAVEGIGPKLAETIVRARADAATKADAEPSTSKDEAAPAPEAEAAAEPAEAPAPVLPVGASCSGRMT